MKTDIDIKDDLYLLLKDSPLAQEAKGGISKTYRPMNSRSEDIVISVLANANGQSQKSTINVNIYVADKQINGRYEEDTKRLRVLCRLAADYFDSLHHEDFWLKLDTQTIFTEDATHEHIINNKLFYQINNE